MVNVLLTIIVIELLTIISMLDELMGKKHEDQRNDTSRSRNVAGGRGEDL